MSKSVSGAPAPGSWNGRTRMPVDVAFERHARGTGRDAVTVCAACGIRHAVTDACRYGALDRGDPSRNGPYRGPLPVREVPPGISGAELHRGVGPSGGRRVHVRAGQIWQGPACRAWRIARITGRYATLVCIGDGRQSKALARRLPMRRGWRLLVEAS